VCRLSGDRPPMICRVKYLSFSTGHSSALESSSVATQAFASVLLSNSVEDDRIEQASPLRTRWLSLGLVGLSAIARPNVRLTASSRPVLRPPNVKRHLKITTGAALWNGGFQPHPFLSSLDARICCPPKHRGLPTGWMHLGIAKSPTNKQRLVRVVPAPQGLRGPVRRCFLATVDAQCFHRVIRIRRKRRRCLWLDERSRFGRV